MSEIINDNSYIIVITIMILAIVIFGGYKKHDNFQIEYDTNNYQFLKSLTIFEKNLQKYNSSNEEILKITDKINLTECLIPNIVDIYFINIKPFSYFNINKHIKEIDNKLMILYDHNKDNIPNNVMLLLNHTTKFGYFYEITKQISILTIKPIYNNSNNVINITILIIKKSFWFS
jgi:hypothetical protein